MQLSRHVHGLSQDYLISCFLSGLKDPIKYKVMAKDPQTMRAAMRLAQLEEEKTPAIKKTSRLNNPKPYGYLQQAPAPNNSGQGSAKAGSKSGGAATLPTQKLTYQEIRERREKGGFVFQL